MRDKTVVQSIPKRLKLLLYRSWDTLFLRLWESTLLQGAVFLMLVALLISILYFWMIRSAAPLPEIKALPLPLRLKPDSTEDQHSFLHVYNQMPQSVEEKHQVKPRLRDPAFLSKKTASHHQASVKKVSVPKKFKPVQLSWNGPKLPPTQDDKVLAHLISRFDKHDEIT